MAVKKQGNCYEVRARQGGRQIKRRFKTKWEAQDYYAGILKGIGPDVKDIKESSRMSYHEFLAQHFYPDLLTGDASKNDRPTAIGTARRAEQRLEAVLPLLGRKRICDLVFADYQEVKRYLKTAPIGIRKQPYKPSTANKVLKLMRQSLRHAQRLGFIGQSPWSEGTLIYAPREEKPHWKLSECVAFLKTVRQHREDHFIYFLIALQTGLRRSELLGLRKQDIDFEDKVIRVVRQWDTDAYEFPADGFRRIAFKNVMKNGAPRKIVPMNPTLLKALKQYVGMLIRPDTPLFSWDIRTMKHPRRLISRYAPLAGVPDYKAHATRDSFIGNMKRAGISDFHIAQIAGCNIQNLTRYGDLDTRDVAVAAAALDMPEILES